MNPYEQNLIADALRIEAEEAKRAGAIGYMARALVQATLPHSKIAGNEFKRINGLFKLTILADSETGLPFGSIPRLLMAWIATEAVKTQSKELILGRTLSDFMAELDLIPTGGRWGSITRLKDQMKRLFSSSISCSYDDGEYWTIKNVSPVSKAELWWNPKSPNQATIFESSLTLSEEFYNEIIAYPVPIDMRILKCLKRSPMALDVYSWLTYRLSYLGKETIIPWKSLQAQFGSSYADDMQGARDFKKAFIRELKKVNMFYTSANFDIPQEGLILRPSKTSIPKHK